MNARELVTSLRRGGLQVWAEDDYVVIEPIDELTPTDRAAILANKPEVLAYLRDEAAAGPPDGGVTKAPDPTRSKPLDAIALDFRPNTAAQQDPEQLRETEINRLARADETPDPDPDLEPGNFGKFPATPNRDHYYRPISPAESLIGTCRRYGVTLSIDGDDLVVGDGHWPSLTMALEAHAAAVAPLVRGRQSGRRRPTADVGLADETELRYRRCSPRRRNIRSDRKRFRATDNRFT